MNKSMRITLNLLPKQYKQMLRKQGIFHHIVSQQLVLSVVMFALLGVLGGVSLLVGQQVKLYETKNQEIIQRPEYSEVLELHSLFSETNKRIKAVNDLQENGIHWSKMLNVLNATISPEVRVSKMSSEDDVVTISGIAETSGDLVLLKNKMIEAQVDGKLCFSDVQIPDEYLVKQNDAEFVMTFTVDKNTCLTI
jgi:Tfp pilus assembly protein PilN